MRVLVIGGSRGIGRNIATHLSKIHEVTSVSRGPISEDVHTEYPNLTHIGNIDVTKDDLNSLDLSKFDAMVNCVGVGHSGYLMKMSESSIDDLINVNIKSVVKSAQAYARHRANLGGIIINMSSITSFRGYQGLSVYSGTKGFINSFTQSLAVELAGKKFRVNAVAPGYVRTEMTKGVDLNKLEDSTPTKRLSTKEDISNMVEFLISDKASNITGQIITVDGGYSV